MVLRSLRPTRATKLCSGNPGCSNPGSSAVTFPPLSVSGILSNPHLHAHDGGSFNDEFNQNVLAVSGLHLLILNAEALMPAAVARVVNDVLANPVHDVASSFLSLRSKPLERLLGFPYPAAPDAGRSPR